ncbi:MAG: hypothetical protein AVDCRST_MAG05-3803, partial [uncultured Rubrobacteraceae bacterium]
CSGSGRASASRPRPETSPRRCGRRARSRCRWRCPPSGQTGASPWPASGSRTRPRSPAP